MEIRVWKSFSCNNSSSYRLVARFADAKTAAEAQGELTEFFTTHATQQDELTAEDDWDWPGPPTAASTALAKKYGFDWKGGLVWGDGGLEGDEPVVVAEGETLVMFHSYCGGFGDDLPGFLKARGAREVEPEDDGRPTVSVLFRLPEQSEALLRELHQAFAQLADGNDTLDDLKAPWSDREVWGKAAFFTDGKTVGFYLPIDPDELSALKAWLGKHGVTDPSIRLCEWTDQKRFDAIGKARCLACHGPLEYLSPRVDPIETEQLECKACGGMFEVKAFVA